MKETNTSADLTDTICTRLTDLIMTNHLNNANLVQIIEHVGMYLNLKTRSQYSKDTGISYNGAKKHRQNINLFGCTFIIDNK